MFDIMKMLPHTATASTDEKTGCKYFYFRMRRYIYGEHVVCFHFVMTLE